MFRLAVGVSLALCWLQFLLTTRWAAVEGAINGPRRPLYTLALAVATIALATWRRQSSDPARPTLVAKVIGIAGLGLLIVGIATWLPPWTWDDVPYLDNWATRYLTTIDGIRLLESGAATGWNWYFLGGYSTATDITQNLALLAWAPVTLFGETVGFHLLQVLLFLSLPALVFVDLRLAGERRTAWFALGLCSVTIAGLSPPLVRSGDVNSLGGLALTMAALVASHAARRGYRPAAPALVIVTAALAWAHVGFLIYAGLLLVLDVALARAWRHLPQVVLAGVVSLLAALPLTWELWRYPDLFLANNVLFDPGAPIDWPGLARKIFYNVELMWLPGRWFNDFSGLPRIFGPLLLFVALSSGRRTQFYAAGSVAAIALMWLNAPEFGYVFQRPLHLLAILPAVALAGALVEFGAAGWRMAAVALLIGIYTQVWWHTVPHIDDADCVEPALVDELRGADGALVLIENTFHRDMDASPDRRSQPTMFGAHFESLLPAATGQRFYAGMWDGMQWVPYRLRLLSGGSFHGVPLADTPYDAFVDELGRWGVAHLAVWSDEARRYLAAAPGFRLAWQAGPWQGFVLDEADTRSVVTESGSGTLGALAPLGGTVTLDDVRRGEHVVVRASYHPAWSASVNGVPVPLESDDGRMAFAAPESGSYDVALAYPARTGLLWLAIGVTLAGALAAWSLGARLRRPGT